MAEVAADTDDPPGLLPDRGPIVGRVPLPEMIAAELRGAIARGGRAGSLLARERELLVRYGVSRPTLREALHVLEAEGLITVRRGGAGGIYVAEPSLTALGRSFGVLLRRAEATVEDVFVARQAIEPAAARLAAETRNSADLERVLRREREALARGEEFYRSEVDFHDALLEAGGSIALTHLGRLLELIVARHAADSMAVYRPRQGPTDVTARLEDDAERTTLAAHRAHKAIVEAIAAGDPDTAERRARKHLHAVLHDSMIDPHETADIFD